MRALDGRSSGNRGTIHNFRLLFYTNSHSWDLSSQFWPDVVAMGRLETRSRGHQFSFSANGRDIGMDAELVRERDEWKSGSVRPS